MTAVHVRTQRWIIALVSAIVAAAIPAGSDAGPINSTVAFTPREGGSILRLQYTYSESDGRGDIQHVNASNLQATYAYGVKQNLALILNIPYANRQVDRVDPKLGRFEDAHDGIADVTVLAKYRFWQKDLGPGRTVRWAVLGGLNIRSGDSDFTSDSYDPILGAVFTWRGGRHRLDADLIYRFNTGAGRFRNDALRYDFSHSFRLFPVTFKPGQSFELDTVAELNGMYIADGSHEVFLSPGLQFITERWTFETSIQLPVIQDFAGDPPEANYRFIAGIRFRW